MLTLHATLHQKRLLAFFLLASLLKKRKKSRRLVCLRTNCLGSVSVVCQGERERERALYNENEKRVTSDTNTAGDKTRRWVGFVAVGV